MTKMGPWLRVIGLIEALELVFVAPTADILTKRVRQMITQTSDRNEVSTFSCQS